MQSTDPSRSDYFPNSSVELDPMAPGKAKRAQERATDARRADAAHDQSIERRVRFTTPMQYGTAWQQLDADRALKRAREAQAFPYCVAPGAGVTSLTRGLLRAGAEVRLEDCGSDHEVLAHLVRVGAVLWVDPDSRAVSPLSAEHTHIVLRSVTAPDCVLVPGSGCSERTFNAAAVLPTPGTDGRIDEHGNVLRAKLATAGTPAVQGKVVVLDLVKRGVLRERSKSDDGGPQAA